MAAPTVVAIRIDVPNNQLFVTVTRSVTDTLTGEETESTREVAGPLNTLDGLGALRNNLTAWVKAQTGFAGTVDVSP